MFTRFTARNWVLGLCLLASMTGATQAHAQEKMTAHMSGLLENAENDLEMVSKSESCKWKRGPDKLKVGSSQEAMPFLIATGKKIVRVCRGTIQCELPGLTYESESDFVCGMATDNCDAYACIKEGLAARRDLANTFLKQDQMNAKGGRPANDQRPIGQDTEGVN